MADDLGEKTEDATPKRLEDEREKGNVPKSTDLASALLLLGVTVMLWAAIMPTLGQMRWLVEYALMADSPVELVQAGEIGQVTTMVFGWMLRIGAPILIVAWVIAYIAHFVQVGWLFAPKALKPKFSKLNPINGFKRIYGIAAVVKASLDTSKVAIVVAVVVVSRGGMRDQLLALSYMELMPALGRTGWLMFDLALRILAVLLILAILDLLYQRWKYRKDLRMSKHEVKDELKQSDGDPETRRRRMRVQQELSRQRVQAAVPRADVIITNPEHISIAIAYDDGAMQAPRVIAKGADHLAFRIRQIAMQHSIPIIERKPLARALYQQVRIGEEIPPEFYQAVAEILAYVYRLSGRKAG